MPVDINLFRKEKGGDPDIVRRSEATRCRDGALVDEVIELDEQWRKRRHELNLLNKELGTISKAIAQKKKASKGKDQCEEEKEQANKVNAEIDNKKEEEKKASEALTAKLNEIGNIVHETVVADKNEDNNPIERTWGEVREIEINETPGHMNHHHLMRILDMYDPERGTKIMGHRGYFLKGFGVLLNQALINYAISFLMERGYNVVQPPYFIKRELMVKTCELGDFEENLYQLENNEAYLIATSEQPISAMHTDEWLKKADMPVKYCGYSSCFRKEAGSSGKDVWGIFRVHQFDKIEQFVLSEPDKSEEILEEMIQCAEEFWKSLNIPYRVVSIVGGALNNAASKKYDLEGWFPGYGEYRELVSCSNCTDYQSRALNVKFGTKKQGENSDKNLVHMLNSTLCATGRAMCAIVENYQTEEGINIPEVLRPYLGNKEFIPYDERALAEFMDEVEKIRAQKNKGKNEKGGKKQKQKQKPKEEKKEEVDHEEAKTEEPKADKDEKKADDAKPTTETESTEKPADDSKPEGSS